MKYYIYILTNKSYTLYVGVTNNLARRLNEHKKKYKESFTNKYNINKLIYFEEYSSAIYALDREKQLKSWRREKKIKLIKGVNPNFREIELR